MAPFLVILLLLALGAGIVAWHTIGYQHPPAAQRRPARKPAPPVPDAVVPSAEQVFAPTQYAPTLDPNPVRSAEPADPFAHAPSFDGDARP
ncbi:hypothetical protein [Brevundimonas sp.]|uniref:hypothetical protein n=1 Tax=Brevundimonas sp. TaxID=1871086 RepID=UPI001A2835C7|nr:hypothetical protein [Brevundimonas sp.]MBJ7486349.1 hypothetical protein [Brevundimonas sp.]